MVNADSALILAGGKSTRMGYDKKRLALDGVRVMDSLISGLGSLFKEVLVSSNEPFAHENVVVVYDELGAGPLAGIYQGLKHCRSDYLYVIACDMPFISAEYIRYVRDLVIAARADVCIACGHNGFYEPFNAFYSKRCMGPIHDALIQQEYKIRPVLDKLNLYMVEPWIVEQYAARDMFFNINRQEDLKRAEIISAGD